MKVRRRGDGTPGRHPLYQALVGLEPDHKPDTEELYVLHMYEDQQDPWAEGSLVYVGRAFQKREYLDLLSNGAPRAGPARSAWLRDLEAERAPSVVLRALRDGAARVTITPVFGLEGDEDNLVHSLDLWARKWHPRVRVRGGCLASWNLTPSALDLRLMMRNSSSAQGSCFYCDPEVCEDPACLTFHRAAGCPHQGLAANAAKLLAASETKAKHRDTEADGPSKAEDERDAARARAAEEPLADQAVPSASSAAGPWGQLALRGLDALRGLQAVLSGLHGADPRPGDPGDPGAVSKAALRREAWQDATTLPAVSKTALRREASEQRHRTLSTAKGAPWVPLANFAVAVGAVSKPSRVRKRRWQAKGDNETDSSADEADAEEKDGTEAKRKAKARRRRAVDWASKVWPAHAALAVAEGNATAAQVKTEEAAMPGGFKAKCVSLDALVAVYGR